MAATKRLSVIRDGSERGEGDGAHGAVWMEVYVRSRSLEAMRRAVRERRRDPKAFGMGREEG